MFPHTWQELSMMLATMMGEGRKTKRERRETMMMMPADLSLGSTALRETSWLPILPVELRREKTRKMQ